MEDSEANQIRFQELIEECNRLLATMDTLQLNTLIERFSSEIDPERTLNYLVDGPSLLSCLITRSVVRPDNLSALVAMAEVAHRTDLRQNIDRFNYSPPRPSLPASPSVMEHAFQLVASSVQNDWRILARQLGITEYQINHIYASTQEPQSATIQVLDLFRRSYTEPDLLDHLVMALRAIRRYTLAAKVDELVKMSCRF